MQATYPTATQDASLSPEVLQAAYGLTLSEFGIDLAQPKRESLVILLDILTGATFLPESEGGCWLCRSELVNDEGYGILTLPDLGIGRKPWRSAHRLSFLAANPGANLVLKVGGETIRLEIHHRCRYRSCFRPSHLRVVTREQNETLKHCPEPEPRCKRHGRYFDVFELIKQTGNLRPRCSVCDREKNDRRRERRRAARRDTQTLTRAA